MLSADEGKAIRDPEIEFRMSEAVYYLSYISTFETLESCISKDQLQCSETSKPNRQSSISKSIASARLKAPTMTERLHEWRFLLLFVAVLEPELAAPRERPVLMKPKASALQGLFLLDDGFEPKLLHAPCSMLHGARMSVIRLLRPVV